MLRGTQIMRENTMTEPTMLSAKNFPDVERTKNTKKSQNLVLQVRIQSTFTRPRLTECVDVQLVDKVPQPLDDILHLLHAFPLVFTKVQINLQECFGHW